MAGWWRWAGPTTGTPTRPSVATDGRTFDPAVDQSTWTVDGGGLALASNGAAETPAVHASWGGNLRWENEDVHVDVYTKRLAVVADENLALEKLQVVQAPWDDTPSQRFAKDKKTAFRLDVANGFAHPVTTQVELRYTQVTGGVPNETVMTKDVTLPAFDTKPVYFEGIRLTGDSVAASATVNPANSPAESLRSDNEAALSSRTIYETKKLDGLFVPMVVPGDFGPSLSQFDSARASWSRYLAETYPIDDAHWLARSNWTSGWKPNLPGYTPGDRLNLEELRSIWAQLQELATLTGHDVAIGVVRKGWFAEKTSTDYSDAVGLAPLGGRCTPGWRRSGQPPQIAAHEIAHTYALIPPGTPGDMKPANDAHFNRLIATGYSASRGEIGLSDTTNPPYDFMQYTAVANTWVSPFVYYTLMNKLMTWAPDPPVVLLSGVVDKEAGSAELRPAYRFDSESDVDLGTTGELGIVFRGAGDVELASAGFDLSFRATGAGLSGSSESSAAPFSVRVPWVDGTEKIELVRGGTVVATRLVSPNAPTVSVTSPAAAAAFSVGETVTVSWSGADTDGGALSYTPMLSTDDGVTWAPLSAIPQRPAASSCPHARKSPRTPRSRCSSPTA